MGTQVNFDVHVFVESSMMGETLGNELRTAMIKAIQEVLHVNKTEGCSLSIRGPEIVSLFH